ncbi:hypothetical protein [uncultured Amnibacterium sp.]|uniref:hypothetical protein n=1 Tax=uncultured Amnibacterium sp. TaxID=1631851 RepID=UPI0035CBE5A9
MGEHVWTSLRRPVAVALLGGALLATVAGCSIGSAPQPTPAPTGTTVVDPTTPSDAPSAAPSVSASASSAVPSDAATPVSSASSTPIAKPVRAVQPFITSADWDAAAATLQVGAVVPGVVEQGGTCTVTATSGGVSRTVTAQASATAQATGCEPLRIPGSQLSAGRWKVVVVYASARSGGTSAPRTVTVTL